MPRARGVVDLSPETLRRWSRRSRFLRTRVLGQVLNASTNPRGCSAGGNWLLEHQNLAPRR
jgi:hypothetical protein